MEITKLCVYHDSFSGAVCPDIHRVDAKLLMGSLSGAKILMTIVDAFYSIVPALSPNLLLIRIVSPYDQVAKEAANSSASFGSFHEMKHQFLSKFRAFRSSFTAHECPTKDGSCAASKMIFEFVYGGTA